MTVSWDTVLSSIKAHTGQGGRPSVKSFEYPGGEITLAIPSEWIEEQDGDEGRMYYQDIPKSGTLRIRVDTYIRPETYGDSKPVDPALVANILSDMAKEIAPEQEHKVALLRDGNQVVQYLRSFLEDDPPLLVVSWVVGIALPPRQVQIASFSYTMAVQDAGSPVVIEEIKLLEGCIREANYSVSIEPLE
jgi:hypothetical protein